MLSTLLELAGAALVVTGIALVSIPIALVVGGSMTIVAGVALGGDAG